MLLETRESGQLQMSTGSFGTAASPHGCAGRAGPSAGCLCKVSLQTSRLGLGVDPAFPKLVRSESAGDLALQPES